MADIKIRFLSQMTKNQRKMAEDGMNMDFRNSKHMKDFRILFLKRGQKQSKLHTLVF
jgi:hypothetical protein